MPESTLQVLADQILKYCWESDPVHATDLGIHDYDYHYADYSLEARQEHYQQLGDFLTALDRLSGLELEEEADRQILRANIKTQLYNETTDNHLYTHAALYPSEALLGVQKLQINYSLPLDHRVQAIMGRLRDMPRLLKQGIENLKVMPDRIASLSVTQALDAVHNGKQFLEEILPQFSGTVPHYFKDLLESNTVALKAMNQFETFLYELEDSEQTREECGCGKAYFEFLLKELHMLDDSVADIVDFGEKSLQHTEKLLHEVARELDPETPWQEQIERLKNTHPSAENLLHYYKTEAERIRDFGIQHELFTLPEKETLAIMETPIFQRSIMPYSGYVSPAPFEDHQTGYFWVTPMNEQMSEEEKNQRLRAHNNYDVILTNVHHAYPGQHLLFVRANEHPSKVRKSFPDIVFAEGWPMYCEEMLYTEELYTDLQTRLFQLKDQLWRACRLILDAKLHLGELSYTDAVNMLVDKIGLDPASAEGEIKRYLLFPTMASGYMLGKREIVRLRQEVADLEGDDFSLKHFHDTVLSCGIVPLSILRKLVLRHYQPEA